MDAAPKPASGKKQLTGLKKRQQIVAANKMIFIWIVVASVAVSTCAVTGQFLFRQLQFNQRVLSARYEARDTLRANQENAEALREAASALVGNEALSSVNSSDDANELQVVFDALPTTADQTAFASSLQTEILPRSGVSLSELSFQQDIIEAETVLPEEGLGSEGNVLAFNFEVEGTYQQILQMFDNLDKTIRPIRVTDISLQGGDNQLSATVTGVTYYQPEISIQPTEETITP